VRSLLRSIALFSVLPVRTELELDRVAARRVLLWLPLVGALLAGTAGLAAAAILAIRPADGEVAAIVAIALMVLLTRGLHLDGLADTVDGLGSRAAAERALEIMHRSDIGPFGVVAIVLAMLGDTVALGVCAGSVWRPLATLVTAAITARVAVACAAVRGVPSARPTGFGALVAGSVSAPMAALLVAVDLGAAAALATAVEASVIGWLVAQLVALSVAALLVIHVRRRIGGMTGDVFGAVVEVTTCIALLAIAVS